MNEIIPCIPTYMSKTISDLVSSDPSIVNLSIGEPYFKPPEILFSNFKRLILSEVDHLGSIPNRYSDSRGEINLRREIAFRYKRLYGAEVDPEKNILITHGAAEAIWLSILTLTSQGDEVLIPDPSYMLYETAVKMLGRIPAKIPTNPENGFCLSVDDIRRSITTKTKLILINSPENPTGAVYDHAMIKDILDLAKELSLYFAHDEVYDSFVFEGQHENIFRHQSFVDDSSILINSFSKQFSMMGWRLGWVIGSKEFIDNAVKVHTNLTLNLGSFHQNAAATILNDSSTESYLKDHVQTIKSNVKILRKALASGWGFDLYENTPKGALFLFPRVSKLYTRIPENYKGKNSIGESVAQYLLQEHKIAIVPGIVYGSCGHDYIRIVASVDEEIAREAASRFSHIMQNQSEIMAV